MVQEVEKRCQQEAAKRDREFASQLKVQTEKKIPYLCKICGVGFDNNHSLQKHIISDHEEQHCQRCPYQASKIHYLVEHHLNKHCLPGSSRTVEISNLMQEVEKAWEQEATKRDQGLMSQSKIKSNVAVENNEAKSFQKASYTANRNLKEGVGKTDKLPKMVVLYKCNWCPTAFYKAEDRTNHVTRMHPEKEAESVEDFVCKECAKTFTSDEMLLNHHLSAHEERNSEIEDNIIDEGLLQAFPELSNSMGKEKPLDQLELNLQVKNINIVSRPKKCNECDRLFPSELTFQRHLRTFHEEKQCDKCPFTTQTNRKLSEHMMKHAAKNYKCNQCNFAASLPRLLNNHVKVTHLKVKEHLCDQCGYASTKPEFMRHHIKAVHDKIQDEICPICHRAFALRHNMTTHMKTHMNVDERKKKPNILKKKDDNVAMTAVANESQSKSVEDDGETISETPDEVFDPMDSHYGMKYHER